MARDAVRLSEEWQGRLATIARNLTDFHESEAATRVRARLADPMRTYSGRTATEARRAAEALAGLWQDYLLVSKVVDEATALAHRSALLPSRDEDVVAMLTGPSIKLPTLSIPISERGLLDPADRQALARPADVLDMMTRAFLTARDTVAAIARAEDSAAPRVATLRAEIDALRQASLALPGALDLPAIDGDLNPLEADSRLSAIEAAVEIARAGRLEAERAVAALRIRLREAEATLATLAALVTRWRAARAEHAEGLADPAPAHDPALDDVGSMGGWLATLEQTVSSGGLRAAGIGLDKWCEACRARTEAVREAHDGLRARLGALDDARGRLRALRAKRAAIGSADPAVARLEAEAKAALARAPCRLAEAGRLLDAYEAALAALPAMIP